MGLSLTRKLVDAHLVAGRAGAGEEIGLRVDQMLLTDTNGTQTWLQYEALGFPRVRPAQVVTYIDHKVYAVDTRNADDHPYLETVSRRHGAWFSKLWHQGSWGGRRLSTAIMSGEGARGLADPGAGGG